VSGGRFLKWTDEGNSASAWGWSSMIYSSLVFLYILTSGVKPSDCFRSFAPPNSLPRFDAGADACDLSELSSWSSS
jgi:hypothetical protein